MTDIKKVHLPPITLIILDKNPYDDISKNLVDKANKILKNRGQVKLLVQDLEKVVKENNNSNVAFISAANSKLFMDGGSDMAYMHAIPDIEKTAKNSLKNVNYKTAIEEKYLPIGCSVLFNPNDQGYKFVVAPTMFLPQKVNKTRNPYYALRAALYSILFYNYKNPDDIITQIYCPTMCTGYGKMRTKSAIKLMLKAMLEFSRKKKSVNFVFRKRQKYYYTGLQPQDITQITQEQPSLYMNRDFWVQNE